jgi:carboxylate-amine ligase
MDIPTVGIEEELMLVDPVTGQLTDVASQALRADAGGEPLPGEDPDTGVEGELFQQQIETTTTPAKTADELDAAVREGRRRAGSAALAAGARAVAVALPVMPDPGEQVTPKPRYQRIVDEYGEMARQALTCAMHVHVEVGDDAARVAVVDRVRPWLPVLLALSANSPFWRGRDTGHASWRSQIWSRWPSGGPGDQFGSVEEYHATARRMVEWGASIDTGMLYFDVRLAAEFPTVEFRVADVCTEVDDAVLVALLTRALVVTEVERWREGVAHEPWRTDLLKAAGWRAARFGVAGPLVHPGTAELAPTRTVVQALLEHCDEALVAAGDRSRVGDLFERMLARGNGAVRQRSARAAHDDLAGVVADLADRTEATWR